jgi:hypothetical protein
VVSVSCHFLYVLCRNRISVKAPCHLTCPRPELEVHRGAPEVKSWSTMCHLHVLNQNRKSIVAPPEAGSGRPRATYLSSAGTGYPSRRHRKLGRGPPRAIFTCPRPEPDIHRGATGSWVGDGHVPFLPVLGRNRISIEAPPEVGWGTATCYALEGEEAAR